MSIVVALENPHFGPPQVYLLDSGDSEASRPMPLRSELLTQMEARLDALPTAPDKDEQVIQIGTKLLDMLSSHPVIDQVVRQKLDANRMQEEPIYLYFKHRMQQLERWPWETMYAPNVGFLAQNRNFAIARAQSSSLTKSEWLFQPPLRILAVLGASGAGSSKIEGEAQWEALRNAVKDTGVPAELRVLTCQFDLMTKINRESRRHPWMQADLIPPRKPASGVRPRNTHADDGQAPRDLLFKYIKDYKPHILHFFSHAVADPLPQLQVGTYSDWEESKPGSILIGGNQLKQRVDLENNIWLITLNCCETAKYGPGTGSLSMPVAATLASEGVPAVVGMREQIPDRFANAFSHLFYRELLEDFQTRIGKVPSSGGLVDIHWACGLFAIRQNVADSAESLLEWTLPVMHTALGFRLQVKGQANEAEANRGAPQAAAQDLVARIESELEDELLQLYEDRKLVIRNKPVVALIDQRIAEIERRLSRS